jgi:omega-hydroxy-beta-dihydromenaquinone-9 sulfotransferase
VKQSKTESPGRHTTGSPDRFWHLRAWSGMNASGWFRALWQNRCAVSPTRIPMVTIQTLISPINSCLGALQLLTHGQRIAETRLVGHPIFVLGHWRSGTTLLHELLVCDPRHTSPNTFACFAPNHFLLTEHWLKRLLCWLVPPTRPMDNMALHWDTPQEDEWALCNMGLPSPYLTIMFPNRRPQHSAYVDLRDLSETDRQRWQRHLKWFLQGLTLRDPRRIVLKSPLHTCRIRAILEVFPEARFVHISRNPHDIFPSTIHTWKQLYKYQGAQSPRYEGLDQYVLTMLRRMYQRFEEDRPLIDPARFCEVRFEDLIADPIGQMQRIYEQIGLTDFEIARPKIAERAERMADFQPNVHELSAETRREIDRQWGLYIQRYGKRIT